MCYSILLPCIYFSLLSSFLFSHRFKCPGLGLFQCSLTGLVFDMTQEVEVLYRIIQWDQSILQSTGKMAAGPLFEIKGCEDAIRQLHFPHCETDEGEQITVLTAKFHSEELLFSKVMVADLGTEKQQNTITAVLILKLIHNLKTRSL